MNLVIWGAGGHGKQVCEVALACGVAEIVFVDDFAEGEHHGRRIAGRADSLASLVRAGFTHFVIAIGDNEVRASCFARAQAAGLAPATLVHPTAAVSPTAKLGSGTVVMPGAIVNASAVTGANCIVNSGAVIEHDCRLGDHVHVSSGAVLGGGVRVGDYTLVGLGAVALPAVILGERVIVGAGAVVVGDVPAGVTVVGVPAKPLLRA